MQFKELPPVQEQLIKCVRCGRCRTVCPIFAEIKQESVAPRGHVFMVQMLKNGTVEPTPEIMERLTNCLMCETCSINCPSGIDIHELNAAARSYIADRNPSLGRNLLFDTIWTRPRLLRTGSKAAALAQKLGLQRAARMLKLTKVLPVDMSQAEKIMDSLPVSQARDQLPAFSPACGEVRFRVAYFLGCGTDMFTPEVAIAAVKVLNAAGCDVYLPKAIKCCGLPHIANAKLDTARKLAVHNARLLNSLDVDYVVTDCASCSAALGEKNMHFMLDGTEFLEEGLTMARRTIDITRFLTEIAPLEAALLQNQAPVRVTYHDPCHLAKAQDIRQQPRELLKMIPGLQLVEMQEPDRCCGGSGTFSMTHYDLSMKVLQHKMDNIMATGATVVATCCPSCTMQLNHGININHYGAKVQHPLQLLAKALDNKQLPKS
ncbi:MAG: (Fe-S)-binding protein [Methylocystaceae bacterium]